MSTSPPAGADSVDEGPRAPKTRWVRSVFLTIAAFWFLIQAFSRLEEDSIHGVIALLQRLAFGFALVAIALVDWRARSWWWLLAALLAVAIVWAATGHPLLFMVGT